MTTTSQANADLVSVLSALADGIIPADGVDAGAAAVGAGPRLAERMEQGVNRAVYLQGLAIAQEIAWEKYDREIVALGAAEIHELLGLLRDRAPAFFKQLRMDVSGLYLSDPAVWQQIEFPGPSTASGGYPDFDQPQGNGG